MKQYLSRISSAPHGHAQTVDGGIGVIWPTCRLLRLAFNQML